MIARCQLGVSVLAGVIPGNRVQATFQEEGLGEKGVTKHSIPAPGALRSRRPFSSTDPVVPSGTGTTPTDYG